MDSRLVRFVIVILIAVVGVSTIALLANRQVALGVLGSVITLCLIGWAAGAGRTRGPGEPAKSPFGAPRPASVPPDGHIRFTLVVEGLEPDRIAQVWSDLTRPDRPATEELRLLFRNFSVVEGRRFRFLRGDPTTTATLLTKVLGAAAGVPVRAHLEPAAERTPPWS